MVISIEPGVCIPGAGGVLWADNYVVAPAGVEPLTEYPIEAASTRSAIGHRAGTRVSHRRRDARTPKDEGEDDAATNGVRSSRGTLGCSPGSPWRDRGGGADGDGDLRDPLRAPDRRPGHRGGRARVPGAAPALRGPARVPGQHDGAGARARAIVDGRPRRERGSSSSSAPTSSSTTARSLDAETVKASIERTKAVNRGGAFFLQALKEVQVVDPMTVRLVATQPSVSLLYGLPKVFITGKARLADADRGRGVLRDGHERHRALPADPLGQGPADRPRPLRRLLARLGGEPRRPGDPAGRPERRAPSSSCWSGATPTWSCSPSIGITQDPKEMASQAGREAGGERRASA